MRISDWSSDVCSSDLEHHALHVPVAPEAFGEVAVVGRGGRREGLEEAVGAFEDRARREESGAREERRPVARLRRPAGMQPLGPGTVGQVLDDAGGGRSEEQTSDLQSLMRSSYAVFCSKKKKQQQN